MAISQERRSVGKISLAIDSGHNIRPEVQGLLERGFNVRFVQNGGIHARVQKDPLLRSVTLYRGQDIPDRLIAGDHHFGILGRDRLKEAQLGGMDLREVISLGISRCDVVVEVPQWSRYRKPEDLDGKRIATSLPNTAIAYFKVHDAMVRPVKYGGQEEGAPAAGVAEGVVSVWVSGRTAKENRLRRFKQPILQSEAVLIASGNFLDERGSELIVAQFIDKITLLAQPEIQVDDVIQPTGFRAIVDRARRIVKSAVGIFSAGNKLTEAAALFTPHNLRS